MQMRIAGLTSDSIVDGPGMRLTVFAQGCEHNCPGCHNPLAQPLEGGRWVDTADILSALAKDPLQSGITLSGGEPLLQPQACLALAQGARAMGRNVWAYTGFVFETLLQQQDPAIMALLLEIDVLVDGPFILAQRTLELPFRGSPNQRLIDVKASLAAGEAVAYTLPQW